MRSVKFHTPNRAEPGDMPLSPYFAHDLHQLQAERVTEASSQQERKQTAPRVAVVGAGAAGLTAALFAARGGAQTLLLERTHGGGKKILISGGGRCNILPVALEARRFVTDSSVNSMRKMLRAWPLAEQRRFFENELALPLVEEEGTGKLFPVTQRARDVYERLRDAGVQAGVDFRGSSFVEDLRPAPDGWQLRITDRPALHCDRVIVATGGCSIPKTGSDGSGFAFARALDIPLHPLYPALTPITSHHPRFTSLAGIAVPVALTAVDGARRAEARGNLLFTHRGYSGPALLDVSHVIVRAAEEGRHDARLLVRWTEESEEEWRTRLQTASAASVLSLLRRVVPERLASALCAAADVPPDRSLHQLRREERHRLLDILFRCPLPWNGHEGYRKAEVTGGGVPLSAVHPATMESRAHPGLHFCGEVLDVFGPIGGYNFFWAWSTGRAAGMAAALRNIA